MKEKLLTAFLLLFAVAPCGTHARSQPRRGKAAPRAAARQQPTPKPAAAKPKLPIPDMGTLADSTYTNKYFGVRMTVPEGWNVHGEAVKAMMMEKGRELFTSDDARVERQLDAVEQRTYNLLMLSKPPSSEGGSGMLFVVGAELVPTWVVNSGSAYLTKSKEVFRYSQIPTEVVEDARAVKLKGMDFGVMTVKMTLPTGAVRQKYYATIKKDYALFFILSYSDEGELKTLEGMMSSVIWE